MNTAQYRADYAGEFVILETKWQSGKRHEKREWISNPIENHHISGRAACIGHPEVNNHFDYTRLERHRGGLLGSKKLQTYGTGDIAHDMRLDFSVETKAANLQTLIDQEYTNNNIVYTTAKNCLAHPGLFYLIPLRPRFADAAISVYLAAFDGHQEVFLLGYTADVAHHSNILENNLTELFQTYSVTKFYIVGEKTQVPNSYLEYPNVSHMTLREWVSYCDV